MDIIRKSFPVEVVKVDATKGIIDAVVAVMGNIDHGDDRIYTGAFTKTLSERGNKVKVLDNHNSNSTRDVIGKPISIREISSLELPDSTKTKYPDATGGLYTVTQFDMKDPNAVTIFNKLADGYIDEWSIGFTIPKGKSDMTNENINGSDRILRNIREVILYEYSPVIWAMNDGTATLAAKNMSEIKKVSLMETYWNVTDAFNSVYCMMDDDHNYFGYMATDVFDNSSMLCRAINIETDFKYYQLNYFINGDKTYRFDDMSDWIGGNYSFVIGAKNTILDLENKAGRVLSQSNFDKITKAHTLLMEVVNSATERENMPDVEDMPMMDDKNNDDLAKSIDQNNDLSLTKQRENNLLELQSLLKTIGVH